jgi:hypothetical protein
MTYEQFFNSIKNLKDFLLELQKLQDVLDVLSPSGTGVCEIGHKFIDDYISLIEITLGDKDEFVNWFVFENDFGNKNLSCHYQEREYVIKNEKDMYDFITILK